MTIKLRCNDYGYECDMVLDEELTVGLIKKLRNHFEEKHGLDYTIEAVTQMIIIYLAKLMCLLKLILIFTVCTAIIVLVNILK